MNRLWTHILAACLLAAMIAIDAASMRHDSLTYDEPTHYRYGQNILKGDSSRFIDGTMPFSVLNALPARLSAGLPPGRLRGFLSEVETGRLLTILFAAALGWLVFAWSRQLYGNGAGLFSLLLYVLSPNIIAHARLITTDVYAAGMVAVTLYYFWRFLGSGEQKYAWVSATMLGLSQLAKYSCIFLYPILILVVLARYGRRLIRMERAHDLGGLWADFRTFLKYALVFVLISIAIINAGFLFKRSMVAFGDYEFRSANLRAMQSRLSFLGHVPVPVPYPYLGGLDWGKMREETGRGFGSMYLFGRLKQVGGFKAYYFFTFLFKEPIGFQVLMVLAAVLFFRNRRRFALARDEVFLIVPVVFYALYLNFIYSIQIGIRHFLVALPFIHVFCGSLVARWRDLGKRLQWVVIALVIYIAASVLSYFPHYVPYFNELVWDRKQAYRILADSNIDWGQALGAAQQYQASHPKVYLERGLWHMKTYREKHLEEYLHPQFPDSGQILVNVNSLVGIYHPHRYKWLRESHKPVGHVAYAYLLFDLSPGAAKGGDR
jgi:4-amino-4-deoxy-L-arabinose transferase-like glycosyltransferase